MRRPTQNVHSRLRARAGFTLAELLVALMVFSVGALAMVATSANVMTLITSSKNRATAAAVAASRFERMRSQPCSAHQSDSASTRGVSEAWQVVKLAKADDVTVRVSFVANHRTQSRIYRSFLVC
ncbi:MAG TPA: prepilin-type N-terminal cleavage/methylation domain-containing protein [Gemmatimonadaceae bacterium]|nr:prepilin-type N-terminal cleavage/methylation domain-containing protein [Gemmatimonadaceae bacterium]